MFGYIKEGWRTTTRHTFLVVMLFIYQLAWSFAVYELLDSIVSPLLHRYPGNHLGGSATNVFMAESQFRLLKTDLSHSYLWILLALFLGKMLLTPLMNAGIYYSLHTSDKHWRFVTGIKKHGKSFVLLYWIKSLLTLLPLYWIAPYALRLFHTEITYRSVALNLLPWLLLWFAAGALLHLVIMYIQFGLLERDSPLHSIGILLPAMLPSIGIAALLAVGLALAWIMALSLSFWWAGLFALILHQIFPLVKMAGKLWGVSSQYHLWCDRAIRHK